MDNGSAFDPFKKDGDVTALHQTVSASTDNDGFLVTHRRQQSTASDNKMASDQSMTDVSLNTFDSSAFRYPASYSSDIPTDPMGFNIKGSSASGSCGMHGNDLPWESASDFGGIREKKEIPVEITLHEEMTCRCDSITNSSSLSVVGKIRMESNDMIAGKSFDLIIDDAECHISTFDFDTNWVTDTTNDYSNLEKGERVFRVRMPEEDEMSKAHEGTYLCCETLRCIPLLVQSRVRNVGQYCRVGVKLCANPSNLSTLTNMAVIMAVPLEINGETVKLSMKGAVWDSLQRIIVWPVHSIQGGDSVEVQAQFEYEEQNEESREHATPIFPVLVRCDAFDDQISGMKLAVTDTDNSPSKYKMNLTRSFRMISRRV